MAPFTGNCFSCALICLRLRGKPSPKTKYEKLASQPGSGSALLPARLDAPANHRPAVIIFFILTKNKPTPKVNHHANHEHKNR
jgi:hypothetical protein